MKPLTFLSALILSCCYFVQCQEDAQLQICEFKEIIRQVEEDEKRMIHDIRIKYERKLHSEKQTNANLKGETGVMMQKVTTAPSYSIYSKLFVSISACL